MAVQKKYLAKIKLPPAFLKTLPAFSPPAKLRVKKLADTKSGLSSKLSSPTPGDETPVNPLTSHTQANARINSGMKELSTAGLTMNNINSTYALDKSGRPCRRWVRRPRQFKTFTGFKVLYIPYQPVKTDIEVD